MGIRENIYKAIFGKPADAPLAWRSEFSYGRASWKLHNAGGSFDTWVRFAFKENDLIQGALQKIINTFNEAEFKVFQEDDEIKNHPLKLLINRPNEFQTTREFLTQIILSLYLGDDAYIEKVRDSRGRVTELWVLRPDYVSIETDDKTFIKGYSYTFAGSPVLLQAEDVIHIKFTDPTNPYYGFSPLKALAMQIDSDNEASEHTKVTLQNRGSPSGVLMMQEAIGSDQIERLAERWNSRFSGKDRGKTAVLPPGMSYQSIGQSMQELDFSALRNVSESRILACLGIPSQVYGGLTGQDAQTYDNFRTALKQFWTQTIIPLQTMISEALAHDKELRGGDQFDVLFDTSEVDALQEDRAAKSNFLLPLYQSGVITKNELRTQLGFEEVDGGEEFNNPFSMYSQSEPETTQDTEDINEEDNKEPDESEASGESQKELVHKHVCGDECGSGSEHKSLTEYARRLKIALGRAKTADKYLVSFDKAIVSVFNSIVRDVDELLGDEKAFKIVKAFERDRLVLELDRLQSSWKEDFASKTDDLMKAIATRVANETAERLGKDPDVILRNANFLRFIEDYRFKFAEKVTETSVDELKKLFNAAYDDGLPLSTVKASLKEIAQQWKGVRAESIARTETMRIANYSALESYKSLNIENLVWDAVLDSTTCEFCMSLDNKVVRPGVSFTGGENDPFVVNGHTLNESYTGGVTEAPPLHPNCRCVIREEI